MNKAEYKKEVKCVKNGIVNLNKKLKSIEEIYIESNKPCEIGDKVEIVKASNLKVIGIVKSFAILQDANVSITSYKIGSKTMYISKPHKKVTIL